MPRPPEEMFLKLAMREAVRGGDCSEIKRLLTRAAGLRAPSAVALGRVDRTRRRLLSPKECAKESFRTVKRGGRTITVCCPRGKFRRGRCRVGTRAQSISRK